MNLKETAIEIMAAAKKYLGTTGCEMKDSAELCYRNSVNCFSKNEFVYAIRQAMTSLRYTVGNKHSAYKQAEYMAENIEA